MLSFIFLLVHLVLLMFHCMHACLCLLVAAFAIDVKRVICFALLVIWISHVCIALCMYSYDMKQKMLKCYLFVCYATTSELFQAPALQMILYNTVLLCV